MFCVRNPRNINVFVRVPGREESGSWPGGSVTGVTKKLFMCQMFMCLFRPLKKVSGKARLSLRRDFSGSPGGRPQGDFFSGKKKEPKPKLFGTDIFRWGGGLPREGVGAKKFGASPKTREIKFFGRDIPEFCRDIPGVPEIFEKKKFVFNIWPLFSAFRESAPPKLPTGLSLLRQVVR